jgi:aspartate 1-decarboxylase
MMVSMLRSKIHRARVTRTDLNYAGSLTLDPILIEASGMLVHEQVHVLNVNTGARFETYVIEGRRGAGEVCLNGAAARLGEPDDILIVITYALMDIEDAKKHKPCVVHVDADNRVVRVDSSPLAF